MVSGYYLLYIHIRVLDSYNVVLLGLHSVGNNGDSERSRVVKEGFLFTLLQYPSRGHAFPVLPHNQLTLHKPLPGVLAAQESLSLFSPSGQRKKTPGGVQLLTLGSPTLFFFLMFCTCAHNCANCPRNSNLSVREWGGRQEIMASQRSQKSGRGRKRSNPSGASSSQIQGQDPVSF